MKSYYTADSCQATFSFQYRNNMHTNDKVSSSKISKHNNVCLYLPREIHEFHLTAIQTVHKSQVLHT